MTRQSSSKGGNAESSYPFGAAPEGSEHELTEISSADVLESFEPGGHEEPPKQGERAAPAPEPGEEPALVVPKKRSFGRFHLLMEMGQGGMATLYLARIVGPQKFEKLVAIKKIHEHLTRQQQFIDMFLDEARIAALIHHPNVATIFDLGQLEGTYFIAMEYVHGQNLTDLLRTSVRLRIPLPWPYAVRIVANAAAGLHAAHELRSPDGTHLNVVHRDVSPQNILVSYDGHVKVVDFGVAFAAEKLAHTVSGTLKGKAAYMSPEQTGGIRLDRRSDIFSLGTVLWESICMKRLFREENEAATLLRVREADVTRPSVHRPDIPPELERIVLKTLAKDRDDRHATADELAEELEELLVAQGEAISNKKISKHMKRLFHHKKSLKDAQIKRALRSEDVPTMKGVEMVGSSGTSIEMVQGGSSTISPPARSRSTLMVLAGGALFAVGAVVLALVLLLKTDEQTHAGKPAATAGEPAGSSEPVDAPTAPKARMDQSPARPPRPTEIELEIVVEPSDAPVVVEFRGTRHKGSRFETTIPPSPKPEQIVVSAKGYHSQNLWVDLEKDKTIPVTLNPKKQARRKQRRYRKPSRRRPPRKKKPRKKPREKGGGLLKDFPE
jgi:serine/threonine-protein kinase